MDVTAAGTVGVSMDTVSGASRVGGPGSENRMQAALGAVSQLFGISTADLQKSLASGQSMLSLAKAQGISKDTLVATIKQAVGQNAPQGAPALSDKLLTRIATRISEHTGAVGGTHHRHHRPAPDAATASPATGSRTGTSGLDVTL